MSEKDYSFLKRELAREMKVVRESVEDLYEMSTLLTEDVMDADDLEHAIFKLHAARKGLGIVNKLPPGPYRDKHASRVMTNLNKIRGLVAKMERRIKKSLNKSSKEGNTFVT